MRELSVKIKKSSAFSYQLSAVSFLLIGIFLFKMTDCYAAPCYGTKLPEKKQVFLGLQRYDIFKRYLEGQNGKLRSSQEFLLLSYGILDWLSLDLKGGAGLIKQHPLGSDELDYPTYLAGGYGFRLKFFDKDNTRMVFGFQHISAHPKTIHVEGVKHKAVLDDWQFSVLASYSFKKITPYLGTRWSRLDYIHWETGERNRVKSDLGKSVGLVAGFDIPLTQKIWVNLEGQFFDSDALAFSLNYGF
jgi:hypothetical protein